MDASDDGMKTMIEDRRVRDIPVELEPTTLCFDFGRTCQACNKETAAPQNKPFFSCSGCKLVHYCSKKCQKADWARHKMEEQCPAIRRLQKQLDRIRLAINGDQGLMEDYQNAFGADNAFPGRRNKSDIFEMIAGRFGNDPQTEQYFFRMHELLGMYDSAAEHLQTAWSWEKNLELLVELKRLTHLAYPDMHDFSIPPVLLKLHRDDDVIAFILHWLDWRGRDGDLQDHIILDSEKGEWPFPCRKDCRLVDILDPIENFSSQVMWVPLEFVLAALTVKMRLVTVYRALEEQAEIFLARVLPKLILPSGVQTIIVSFLTGGANYGESQLGQAERLMDYIDGRNRNVLAALLNPELEPPAIEDIEDDEEGHDADMMVNARDFLEDYGDGQRVIDMLKSVLVERTGQR